MAGVIGSSLKEEPVARGSVHAWFGGSLRQAEAFHQLDEPGARDLGNVLVE